MRVLVIGANGKVGRRLVELLGESDHEAMGLIRDPSQAERVEAAGAEPVVGDLEGDVSDAIARADAVVFTAGSGGHTGGDKTLLVDLWGALKTIRAAEASGVKRYVMVSAVGAADPDQGRPALRHYLVAKHLADRALQTSGLDYTIVRPGRLNDDPGTGRVRAGADIGYGSVPRDDVARTVLEVLDRPATVGKTFCLLAGDTPIAEALSAL